MKKIAIKYSFFLFALLVAINSYAQSNFSSKVIGVGVVVSDLERSLDFYMNGIGMVKTGSFTVGEDFAKRSGLSNGESFSVTILKLENSAEASEWKLMSFDNEVMHPQQKFIQEDVGMQYITIHVKALNPIIERLKQREVLFLGSTPTALNGTTHFLLVQDPDGVFIELIGPME